MVTREDILRYIPLKKGIDILYEPTRYNSSIYVATISGSSLDGIEKSDIDEELTRLNVVGDRIRNPNELKKIPQKAVTKQANIKNPIFKENKDYEDLLSKIKGPVVNDVAIVDEG